MRWVHKRQHESRVNEIKRGRLNRLGELFQRRVDESQLSSLRWRFALNQRARLLQHDWIGINRDHRKSPAQQRERFATGSTAEVERATRSSTADFVRERDRLHQLLARGSPRRAREVTGQALCVEAGDFWSRHALLVQRVAPSSRWLPTLAGRL